MGNAFNREAPQNGSVWIATYDQDAARYVRTVTFNLQSTECTPIPITSRNRRIQLD